MVCDPRLQREYNYHVDVAIELKKSLSLSELRIEIQKFFSYEEKPGRLYIVSGNATPLSQAMIDREIEKNNAGTVHVIVPGLPPREVAAGSVPSSPIAHLSIDKIIAHCISETLQLYGTGRAQYHGFYWCNYEHERAKGWTFPVEGDFNCQLYHRLRIQLPSTCTVLSEVKPTGLSERADFFIKDGTMGLSFTIETKMNWDQFKPKFKNGVLGRSEADTILHKFAHHGRQHAGNRNILIVIQGVHGHKSTHRAKALNAFSGAVDPVELFYFDEEKECVARERFGPH